MLAAILIGVRDAVLAAVLAWVGIAIESREQPAGDEPRHEQRQ
jgi:hypothetical protein